MTDGTHLLMDLRSEKAAYRKMALPMARAVSSADDRFSTELLPCRQSRHGAQATPQPVCSGARSHLMTDEQEPTADWHTAGL